jgi:hypothetical protein
MTGRQTRRELSVATRKAFLPAMVKAVTAPLPLWAQEIADRAHARAVEEYWHYLASGIDGP